MFFVPLHQFNALSIQNDFGFFFSESWLSIKVIDCLKNNHETESCQDFQQNKDDLWLIIKNPQRYQNDEGFFVVPPGLEPGTT